MIDFLMLLVFILSSVWPELLKLDRSGWLCEVQLVCQTARKDLSLAVAVT